jgi:dimethylargininase
VSGAHLVLLGGNKLLLAADCPRTAEFFSGLGYEPVAVEIGEFQKLEGCVTCLSVLLN